MKGYFLRVKERTPTRLWINNPTAEEARKSIAAGAIACTTNPSYASKLLSSESERPEVLQAVSRAVSQARDDQEAVDLVQQQLARRIMREFLPLHTATPGREGFVSIQGNPLKDTDADGIVNEALRYAALGANFIAKIPTTEAGLAAMEALLRRNVPVIATEIMAIAQAVAACEIYRKASRESGRSPAFFVTHITGIFDEYLRETVERDGIAISPQALAVAGAVVARKQYHLMKERGYPGILLGGGARGLSHFTDFVGGEVDITINWKGTADKLIDQDDPVVPRIDTPEPRALVDELLARLPDFARAYREDGLAGSEYAGYGPVVKFRDSFVKGWAQIQDLVGRKRAGKAIA
jgi:transaldolase